MPGMFKGYQTPPPAQLALDGQGSQELLWGLKEKVAGGQVMHI